MEPRNPETNTFGILTDFGRFEVRPDFPIKIDGSDFGYFVLYEDGYHSWSPTKAFEEGYTEIKETSASRPSIGRIVLYTLTESDAEAINRRRTNGEIISSRIREGEWPEGTQAHIGNLVTPGEQYPAVVVRVFDFTGKDANPPVNLQVLLDGCDSYWATSRTCGEGPLYYQRPSRV